MRKVLFSFVASFLFGFNLCAENMPVTPVMISLMDPVQAPPAEWSVKGFRLNLLYGRCEDMYGLDLGLVNQSAETAIVLEAGLVNYCEGNVTGLQIGGVNIGSRVKALQVGIYNEARDMSGLQIGLINHTQLMRGMQIGLINVIDSNDLAFLPVVNFFF